MRGSAEASGPMLAAGILLALGLSGSILASRASLASVRERLVERLRNAVLHAENVTWGRSLHDALRLPDWVDLAFDHRDRFELLDDPWRPG